MDDAASMRVDAYRTPTRAAGRRDDISGMRSIGGQRDVRGGTSARRHAPDAPSKPGKTAEHAASPRARGLDLAAVALCADCAHPAVRDPHPNLNGFRKFRARARARRAGACANARGRRNARAPVRRMPPRARARMRRVSASASERTRPRAARRSRCALRSPRPPRRDPSRSAHRESRDARDTSKARARADRTASAGFPS